MRYLKNNILNPVTINTKLLSILTLLFFICALLLGSYLFSFKEGQISGSKFTISQALAYSNKAIAITLFGLSLISALLLNYARGGDKFSLYLRYFLISVSYILIITIIFITVKENRKLHFNLAGIIFLFQFLYILIVSNLYNRYLNPDCDLLIAIDFNIILAICSFVLLVVFGIFEDDETAELDNVVFASSENLTVFLNLLPMLYLGFI